MGAHPINLVVRFILEIIALVAVGTWGWNKADGWLRFLLGIGLPVLLGVLWTVFAVPDDPSRSGQTVIVTSGVLRLALEFGIFAVATIAIYNQGQYKFSYVFAFVVIVHYLISYDRIIWLLDN